MKAARFYGPGDLRVEEVEVPKIGKGELLIRNHVALTCGTDLKMFLRGHRLATPPLIIGHEFAGTVEKIGEGVEGFEEGMRVVAANSAPCMSCYYCRIGKPNLCDRLDEVLVGFSSPGAYAEYVRLPARIVKQNTYEIPKDVPFEAAAFVEPLACVVHGIELSNIKAPDLVFVIGAGPIGLLHVQLAKVRGAGTIVVADASPERLQRAAQLGADKTVTSSDTVGQVRSLTDNRGADVTIEAVGKPETWELAVRATRKGGTTVLFGGCPAGSTASIDTGIVHYGELTLKGVFHHTPSDVRESLRLISTGQVKVASLVTHRMKLTEVEAALRLMQKGAAIKVAITP
ncbi:MAG: zinc-binding dehydrogenase [Candidatus Bathyarchaeia archaeon]